MKYLNRGRVPIKAKEKHIRALFEYMDANGIPIYQASDASGVAECNISNWRSGKSSPRLDLFMAVCEAVGLLWTVTTTHKKRQVVVNQMELPL